MWCRPVGAWQELLPESDLKCTDKALRAVERSFRQVLIKHEIGDDSPVEPAFPVGVCFDVDPPNVWGVDIRKHRTDAAGGS